MVRFDAKGSKGRSDPCNSLVQNMEKLNHELGQIQEYDICLNDFYGYYGGDYV
jgi:hypothetical protein